MPGNRIEDQDWVDVIESIKRDGSFTGIIVKDGSFNIRVKKVPLYKAECIMYKVTDESDADMKVAFVDDEEEADLLVYVKKGYSSWEDGPEDWELEAIEEEFEDDR